MPLTVTQIDRELSASNFGPKAHWLSWLTKRNLNVPPAFAFQASTPETQIAYACSELGRTAIIQAASNYSKDGLFFVVVRSSATNEDGLLGSQAGKFDSFLGPFDEDQLIDKYCAVAESSILAFPDDPPAIGIIIQSLVEPICSGVAFSANPVSGTRKEAIISIANGTADKLVAGAAPDEEIIIPHKFDQTDDNKISSKLLSNKNLDALVKTLVDLEKMTHLPVDIEWAIDKYEKLHIVQFRPIVFPKRMVTSVSLANENQLPPIIRNNPKVSTRLEGERLGIHVSPARVIVRNKIDDFDLNEKKPETALDEVDCAGHSVVLLHPRHIMNKVQRFFVGDAKNISSILEKCERYAVRDYPEFDQIENCVSTLLEKGLEKSWYSVGIVQTIYQAEYTGIVKREGEYYLIEMARGHFVPKGIVDTAMHILSLDLLSMKNVSCKQRKVFDILDGAIVIGEDCKETVSIDNSLATSILNQFRPLIDSGTVVEFGMTYERGNNPAFLYLIDVVDSSAEREMELDISLLDSGVISPGSVVGKAFHITDENEHAVHSHFHDEGNEGQITIEDPIVYFANMPSISLQSYLNHPSTQKIGFVFASGSLLSHFSILLREAGIPAMVLNEKYWPNFEDTVILDCMDQSLSASDRIRKVQ